MSKIIRIVAFWLLTFCIINPIWAQRLEGRLTLSDSIVAQYATVYVPALGQGAMADANGHYHLEDIPAGNWEVEYSYLGYKTVSRKMDFGRGQNLRHDLQFEQQPVRLDEVFVTPDGTDPAVYILTKVAEQARVNKKRLTYDARMNSTFHAQDFDFIPVLAPKGTLWVFKLAFKKEGVGELAEFCMEHEQVDAVMSSTHHYNTGKSKYTDERLVSATPELTKGVRKQLFSKFVNIDLFHSTYGSLMDAKPKDLRKTKYKLKGIIEEGGRTIDVLESEQTSESGEIITQQIYVVEGTWGIQRRLIKSGNGDRRLECRDIGNGIYMPISLMMEPSKLDLSTEMAKMEESLREDDELPGMAKRYLDRMHKYLESKRSIRPDMTLCYTVKYENVRIGK